MGRSEQWIQGFLHTTSHNKSHKNEVNAIHYSIALRIF